MEVVFILIPISLVIVGVALWAFVWSVRNDQFEDLEKEAFAILFENDQPPEEDQHTPEEKGASR